MTWADWLVLTCGVSGVVLAQIPATQKYACFAGGLGQIGWFNLVNFSSQPGIWLTCVVYSLAWGWGFWLHWLMPWLESFITTPTAGQSTGPRPLKGTTTKPRLRLAGGKDKS